MFALFLDCIILTSNHLLIGRTSPPTRHSKSQVIDHSSSDTILRRVKAKSLDPGPPPRYVGGVDWAVRKGRSYGTAVIDLERARVIALFSWRDGEVLAEWL